MTRVLHTADTHVGYRQYHSPERRADFLRAFESVVADAVADDVDAVVHAGDLFHDRRPGLADIQGVIDALGTLDDADIPFLAVVGNHETKRDGQWLDLFEDLGLATRLGREPVVVDGLAVYGQDFVPEAAREDLAYDFEPVDAEFAALVSHGAFEPFAHADWDTAAVLDGSPVAFDAALLGDIHHPGREEVEDTLVTYPGSTERASAEERDDRGYNVVEFDADADVEVSLTRRSVAEARAFVFVDLDLAEGEGEGRVLEAVRQHDLEDAVLIVTVEGEGDPVTPAAVEEFAADRGALIARVNDRRELVDEADTAEVTFADPDRAVRERLAEVGLSEAALGVDDLVRTADDVADSRVREATKRRVRERLEEDPGALEGVADATPTDGASDSDDGGDEPTVETGDADEATTAPADGAAPDASGASDGADGADGEPENEPAESEVGDENDDGHDEPEAEPEPESADESDDDAGGATPEQASVEEYL